MAGQFQLVSAIMTRAARQADILGQDDRWTAAEQLSQFNASAGELRLRLSNLGFDWFLERATGTLSTSAAVAGETYSEIDWPVRAQRIYGIHVLFQADLWLPLHPTNISGLRDYQRHGHWAEYGLHGREPAAFALKKAPFGAAAVETVGKIMIVPVPAVARSYVLWYLENFAPMASSETFNGHASFVEWIVQDMVVKYSEGDNNSNETHAIAFAERARLEELFAAEAPKTQLVSTQEPRRIDDDFCGWDGPRMVD